MNTVQQQIDAAALRMYANDLDGMREAEIAREIRRIEAILEEEEPWLEALHARLRQIAAERADFP